MASLVKLGKYSGIIKNSNNAAVIYTSVRNHYWNKDWKPGPYPRTPEEREAAAKKYGLHPSEYQPYPDDGVGFGDYPKLPDVGPESKDPYYPYDFPETKRNFNEPIHQAANIIGADRFDPAAKFRFPMKVMWGSFLGVMSGFGLLYYILEDMKMFRPVLPKQLPSSGGPHYTFELK